MLELRSTLPNPIQILCVQEHRALEIGDFLIAGCLGNNRQQTAHGFFGAPVIIEGHCEKYSALRGMV